MKTISEILTELNSTSSKNDKIVIIIANNNNITFRKVLVWTYDTINILYHVKKLLPVTKTGQHTIESGIKMLEVTLDDLSNRTITGNDALQHIKDTMELFTADSQDIIVKILQRDLKCGFSASSINKAIPGLIPVFNVALATDIKGHESKIWKSSWFLSRKLDGCRCIAMKQNGEWKFFSRQGKEKDMLNKLILDLDLLTTNCDNIVFDGELCIFDGEKENFKAIASEFQKKDHNIENPRLKIFDYLTIDEFFSQTSGHTLYQRLKFLSLLFGNDKYETIEIHEQILLTKNTYNDMMKKVSESWKNYDGTEEKEGWEGLIARKDTFYKGKRSTDILKIKMFMEEEFVVESIEQGDFTTTKKRVGQVTLNNVMTAAIIKLDSKHLVNIGSGWSLEQRLEFSKHPERIIGKTIKVQFQGYSTNKQGGKSLRIPTVRFIYENGRFD